MSINLARYYPYTLLVSVEFHGFSTQILHYSHLLITHIGNEYIRTSTVLGRFYYGVSRHSTPGTSPKGVALFTELQDHHFKRIDPPLLLHPPNTLMSLLIYFGLPIATLVASTPSSKVVCYVDKQSIEWRFLGGSIHVIKLFCFYFIWTIIYIQLFNHICI